MAVFLLSMVNAPAARADWTSYIDSWNDGQESRRWDDTNNTGISFAGCMQQGGGRHAVDLRLWRDIPWLPDGLVEPERTATACFNYSGRTSTGVWTGLVGGSYYFEAHRISDGNSCCLLFVNDVSVDTTP